ncbi:hypothetical protein CVT26_014997 [Gymnopilus dilepis]|uniref:Uncharacterized protein n=1 Tax=Gymnopilus dilepis TaxID=231916 RepID=A0A409XBC9_9AGAR|nr:hypothetical protein CVT26_014997 [Gymnopilus dilepis]
MWAKYLEGVRAVQAAKLLSNTRRWPQGLHYREELIISIFAPKSTWYRSFKSLFSTVEAHAPEMKAWLEKDITSRQEDMDVWGYSVNEYGEADLRDWLGQRGFLGSKAAEEAAEAESREQADRLERLEQQMQVQLARARQEQAEQERAAIYNRKKRKNTRR